MTIIKMDKYNNVHVIQGKNMKEMVDSPLGEPVKRY